MKLWLIPAIAIAIGVASCGKDDDDDNPPGMTRTELIAASVWKYDTAGIDADRNGTMDTSLPPGIIQSCDTDNTLTFRANGTGTLDEGATKCDDTVPQTSEFTWSFSNNENVVTFSDSLFTGIDGNVNIISLTENDLTLSKEVTISAPLTVNVIIKLKH
jgi:hypothetical protein